MDPPLPTLATCQPSGILGGTWSCRYEIDAIHFIQSLPFPTLLTSVSEVLHPKYALVFCSSLAKFVGGPSRFQQLQVMGAWMLCDGLHYLLKWFFAGDRPYWVGRRAVKNNVLHGSSTVC